jgi:hypothetical protein
VYVILANGSPSELAALDGHRSPDLDLVVITVDDLRGEPFHAATGPLGAYANSLSRSVMNARDGHPLAARLDAAERRWLPDFITPRPQSRVPEMAEELAVVRCTDPAVVGRDIETAYRGQRKPSVLCGDPAGLRDRIADALEAYWHVALEPHWRRMRAVLEADILYRAQLLADGGAAALFAGLTPTCNGTRGFCGCIRWEPAAGCRPAAD